MGQFLRELSEAFEGEKGIENALKEFDKLKETNPRKYVDAYMNGISPPRGKNLQSRRDLVRRSFDRRFPQGPLDPSELGESVGKYEELYLAISPDALHARHQDRRMNWRRARLQINRLLTSDTF